MAKASRSAFVWVLGLACACSSHAQDATALRERGSALQTQLASSPFKRPLTLTSEQSTSDLKGDVYAVIDQPFALIAPALQGPGHWCELLMLHLNVKGCSATGHAPNEALGLVVGRKSDQALDDGYRIDFRFSMPAPSADYLKVRMTAEHGPLSTSNYRLAFEATPLDDRRSFVHLSYAYSYGFAARIAMQGYLATAGRGKVGFSVTGLDGAGQPVYVNGVRGVVERNTMRYYLAIEAYLGALSVPPAEQLDKRLHDWFAATERTPLQLHEVDQDAYLQMKRREVLRQQQGAKAAAPD